MPVTNFLNAAAPSGLPEKPALAVRYTERAELTETRGTAAMPCSMRLTRASTSGAKGSSHSARSTAYSPVPKTFWNSLVLTKSSSVGTMMRWMSLSCPTFTA